MSDADNNPPDTGHPVIDAALAELDLAAPVSQHAEQYQAVHTVLNEILNPSDATPRPGSSGR